MTHYFKKILGGITIVSLVLMLLPLSPDPSAASLTDAKVQITDSKPQATNVAYKFYFQTGTTTDEVEFKFDNTFFSRNGTLPNGTSSYYCATGWTPATTTDGFKCTVATPENISSTTEWKIEGVVNPTKSASAGTADVYYVDIITKRDDTEKESVRVKFAIIEGVVVKATVDAILEFEVAGTGTDVTIQEVTTTVSSEPTAINFGTLSYPNASSQVAAQVLTVRTNASDGFFVYVFQDDDLRSAANDTIKCFKEADCKGWYEAETWSAPQGLVNDENTWGHFGFASADGRVKANGTDPYCDPAGGGVYTGNKWAGFEGDYWNYAAPVMCYTRPYQGSTTVGYRVHISPLQPAGEYTNVLTYIATPTY